MLKLRINPFVAVDLKGIRDYIAEDNEKYASKTITEIYSKFENIQMFSGIGSDLSKIADNRNRIVCYYFFMSLPGRLYGCCVKEAWGAVKGVAGNLFAVIYDHILRVGQWNINRIVEIVVYQVVINFLYFIRGIGLCYSSDLVKKFLCVIDFTKGSCLRRHGRSFMKLSATRGKKPWQNSIRL